MAEKTQSENLKDARKPKGQNPDGSLDDPAAGEAPEPTMDKNKPDDPKVFTTDSLPANNPARDSNPSR